VRQLTRQFEEGYEKKTRNNASIFACRPAGGAKVIK